MTITEDTDTVTNPRTALDGPSIEEILSAVSTISKFNKHRSPLVNTDNGYTIDEVEVHAKAKSVLAFNQMHLANQGTTRINKANLMTLIQIILKNGERFDMTSFIYGANFNTLGECQPLFSNKMFTCDTVGCIAGFATAIATDWSLDPQFINNNEMNINGYLHIACNYLNIPILVGKNIFYSGEDSIWSFIKSMMEDGTRLSADFNEIDWCQDADETSIELSTINNKAAAELLRMIHDDELLFDKDYLPYFAPSVGGNY